MNTQDLIKVLKELRTTSKERKFSQTFDLIVILRGLNLKKPEEQIEFFTQIPHAPKKLKICAFVGPELQKQSEEVMDKTITPAEFDAYKDKKLLKALAVEYDFFIAQADVMPKVAAAFGRALGPRGKMPNPKAGQIIPPKGSVQPVYERLQKTVKLAAKKQLAMQIAVGDEKMKDEDIAENIKIIYDQIVHHLPQEQNNIKGAMVKLTMGKPVKIL